MPETKKPSKKPKTKRKVTRRPTQNQSNHQNVTVKIAGAGGGRVGGGFGGGGGGAGGAGASTVVAPQFIMPPTQHYMGHAPRPFHMQDVMKASSLDTKLRNIQSEHGGMGPGGPSGHDDGEGSVSMASRLTRQLLSDHDAVSNRSARSSMQDYNHPGDDRPEGGAGQEARSSRSSAMSEGTAHEHSAASSLGPLDPYRATRAALQANARLEHSNHSLRGQLAVQSQRNSENSRHHSTPTAMVLPPLPGMDLSRRGDMRNNLKEQAGQHEEAARSMRLTAHTMDDKRERPQARRSLAIKSREESGPSNTLASTSSSRSEASVSQPRTSRVKAVEARRATSNSSRNSQVSSSS